MLHRPIIGVTGHISKDHPNLSITNSYMEGLFVCGAFPVLLPIAGDEALWAQAAREMDGFLFSGGVDVEPSRFGEETMCDCGEISPQRDAMEIALLQKVLPTKKPVFGICRGIQLLNIALGGTIYQDIYAQNAQSYPQLHSQKMPDYLPCHDVMIEEGSLLYGIVHTLRLPVNSLHHQAVKDCAPGLIPIARSSTGLIEALEKKDHPFFFGVQWHPERMWKNDEAEKAIMQAFVSACLDAKAK